MIWTKISMEYRTDLYIYRRSSAMTVRYQDEVPGPIVKPYAVAVCACFILTDDNTLNKLTELSLLANFWRMRRERVWSGGLSSWTLIQLKIFGIASAVLYVEIYHLQPSLKILKLTTEGMEITLFYCGWSRHNKHDWMLYTLYAGEGCSHTQLI